MSVDVFTVDSEQIAVTTDALTNLGVMTVDGETTVVAVGSGSTDVQIIESGPPGAAGPTGATGSAGPAGSPGALWYSATGGPPASGTGIVGDYGLVTSGAGLGDIYKKTGTTTWTLQGNIRGATGATGAAGTNGTNGAAGSVWFNGTVDPTSGTPSAAIVGDYYLNTTSGDVFKKTGSTTWTLQGNIKGPAGTGGGTGSALTVRDEGTALNTAVADIDFVGTGVTATYGTSKVTVSIPGPTTPNIGEAAWTTPTLNAGWSNNSGQTLQYRKDANGKVRFQGAVTGGTGTIFTLPLGYRPAQIMVFATSANGAFASVVVNPDGTVVMGAGSVSGVYMATVEFYDVAATVAGAVYLGPNVLTYVQTADFTTTSTTYTDVTGASITFTPTGTSISVEGLIRTGVSTSGGYLGYQVLIGSTGYGLTLLASGVAGVQQNIAGKRVITGLTPNVPVTIKIQAKVFTAGHTLNLRAASFPLDEAMTITVADAGAQGGTGGDSAWIAPTAMQNGWVDAALAGYPPLGYRKDALGFVHLRGYVKNGTSFQAAFTLPSGYRPAYKTPGSGSEIGPTGTVTILSTSQTDLGSTVPFLAEA